MLAREYFEQYRGAVRRQLLLTLDTLFVARQRVIRFGITVEMIEHYLCLRVSNGI